MKKSIVRLALSAMLLAVAITIPLDISLAAKEKTLEEWDAAIKQHSLHLKYDYQLLALRESIEAKIPRVTQDLFEHKVFPDAIKKEIYLSLVDSGEIIPEPLDTTRLTPANQAIVDSEYLSRTTFYQDKKIWLEDKLICCLKEMELRADELVVRKPLGTVYYIDFDNGHDVNNDGSSKTKTNGDGPFATLDKYTSIAVAGDIGIARRGMTQAVSADLAFANDGTIVAPITLEADFDDIWGDESVAGETATLIFGSKTVTFAGDISGDIAANDWIYEATEDNRVFAYEVASVTGGSNEVVTLYLPYKGNISGAGKTINIMPDNPIWNTAAGAFSANMDGDHYWKLQGLHLRGTSSSGVIESDGASPLLLLDMILEGNTAADICIRNTDQQTTLIARKLRTFNCIAIYSTYGGGGIYATLYDSLFDGNSQGQCAILNVCWDNIRLIDCESKGFTVGDINAYSDTDETNHTIVKARNVIFGSATEIDDHQQNFPAEFYSEDHDGTLGDNRQLNGLSVAEGTPSLQSDTGATLIKITPSANLDTDWEFSRVLIFEYPIYAVKDVEKTYTVYLRSDDDTDWDADPLNTELWIEAEYWGHATNVHRKILKSTEVCNNFDADDTVYDELTVTVTPLQTGVLYLRGYYCKTLEGGKSNIFYCKTAIGIS